MSSEKVEGGPSSSISNDVAVNDDVHSQLSTPSQDKVADDLMSFQNDQAAAENSVDIPQKPASAYVGVSLLCAMIAFGGFVFGWDTGTISGFVAQTDFLRRFGSYSHTTDTYYLSNARTGLVVSIFNIGCAIGGITLGSLGDMYGRKIGLMAVTVVYVIGILIQICSFNKWYQYFIGRIISGLGVGGISVLSPMMIGETSPKHLRGTLVACYQLMITLGIFLGYCTNYGTLEAFSHNPTDGSFAAMPDQTAAKTNYLNELFLSY
ncbi:uncharacterized protein SCODWIG_04015 [Saccharomycodes ludwigii]|uniref:Major facilitator superfamily (MFS) profile domain-containing protein n=1 Tax=Saccharomycodes ludwigii TaxID=36035 RepID=A0A376BC34_9ASCO|nr:uncharacterized protein SCODWIG_04015 [Saccharomycodes ludwigii]